MSLAAAVASLPDTALRAMSLGLRSGSLTLESSAVRIASTLGIPPEAATGLLRAAAGTTDAAGLALACECALEARQHAGPSALARDVELVLSGPVVEGVEMRATEAVFASLIREARHEVLVTSFVAGYARELLAPLADFLDADPDRKATLVLNFQRGRDTTVPEELAARLADDFWRNQWPAGARRPTLGYDPRGLAMDPRARATMHAKVVVIDRRMAFVTSANLTARAQTDNIELGVLVHHEPFAARIATYFEALMARGELVTA